MRLWQWNSASGQRSTWGISLYYTLPHSVKTNSHERGTWAPGERKHFSNDIIISFSSVSRRTKYPSMKWTVSLWNLVAKPSHEVRRHPVLYKLSVLGQTMYEGNKDHMLQMTHLKILMFPLEGVHWMMKLIKFTKKGVSTVLMLLGMGRTTHRNTCLWWFIFLLWQWMFQMVYL